MRVVATFSILADFVKAVGQENVVISIVGPNSDAHVYEPTPQDVRTIQEAELVFINGLGFEGWMDRLISASGYNGIPVVVTDGINPRTLGTQIDPHAWHNVQNAKVYVHNILKAFQRQDPARRSVYQKNAEDYLRKLEILDQWIEENFDSIPLEKRQIITAHDAFGYFSDRYGVQVLSPVGISTEAEPTPKTIANLIDIIRKKRIKIIFIENIGNPKILKQIADETGAKIGAVIYSDALSEQEEPGYNYEAMMRHNVSLFKQAMIS